MTKNETAKVIKKLFNNEHQNMELEYRKKKFFEIFHK